MSGDEQTAIARLEATVNDMRGQLEEARSDILDVRERVADTRAEVAVLQPRISALEASMSDMRPFFDGWREARDTIYRIGHLLDFLTSKKTVAIGATAITAINVGAPFIRHLLAAVF